MAKLNVNDVVWVKLAPTGLEILQKQHADLKARCPGIRDWTPPSTDENGYSSHALWTLLQDFGHAYQLGNGALPFGTEIRLSDPSLVPKETIVRAACKHNGAIYDVPAPGRHHNVIRMLVDMQLAGPANPVTDTGGFLTSTGRYVDREEAWLIAEAAGQLLARAPTDGRGGMLYSEDVW